MIRDAIFTITCLTSLLLTKSIFRGMLSLAWTKQPKIDVPVNMPFYFNNESASSSMQLYLPSRAKLCRFRNQREEDDFVDRK